MQSLDHPDGPRQPGMILCFSLNWRRKAQSFLFFSYRDESDTMIVAAALDAATILRLSGMIADPSLNTKRVPKRCSSGMIRLNVASISSLGR